MSKNYDVIVIGGGHNGLTLAGMLARKGRKVLVLERNAEIGGLAAGSEFVSGFTSPGMHLDCSRVSVGVAEALQLKRYGLQFQEEDPGVFFADPNATSDSKQKGIHLFRDAEKSHADIASYSPRDAEMYGEYRKFFKRVGPFIFKLMDSSAPDINTMKMTHLMTLASTALSLRMLGKRDMTDLLRVAPMCVADWMNDWFESDLLKAGLSAPSIYHSFTGPWSPGTNLNLLVHEAVAGLPVRGGARSLVQALSSAVQDLGVEVRTDCRVKRILVESAPGQDSNSSGGRVRGVLLDQEEMIHASAVAGSCDPKTLFQDLVAPEQMSVKLDDRIENLRTRGTAARLNLALSRAPELKGRPAEFLPEFIRLGESLDTIEKSFDPVKYGDFARRPTLEIQIPTVSDPSLAPAGGHVMAINIHFAAYDQKQKWSEEARGELLRATHERLKEVFPEIQSLIVGEELLTPVDIEKRYHVRGGQVLHGEHTIDQMMTRPTPETAQYRTPIEGLYLCGSGSHPGGGLTCRPGFLAAETLLADRR